MKRRISIIIILFVWTLNYGQEPIELGDPIQFTDWVGSVDGIDICSISTEKIIVAYYEGGIWNGVLKVGTIENNNSLVFGNDFVFKENNPPTLSLTPLSNSKFFIVYQDLGGLFVKAGKVINDDEIILGNEFPIENIPYFYSLTTMHDDTAVVAYHDGNRGVCKVIETDESLSVSISTSFNFTDTLFSNSESISIDALSNSSFVIAYGNIMGSPGDEGNVRIGTIDQNNQINYGPISQFSTNNLQEIIIMSLQANKFAVVFTDEDNNNRGVLVIGTIDSNNQITYSDNLIFYDDLVFKISASMIASNEVIIGYTKSDATSGVTSHLLRAEIEANTILFSDPILYNENADINGVTAFTKLEDHQFIVQYLDDISFAGYIRFGETDQILEVTRDEKILDYSIYTDPFNILIIEERSGLEYYVDLFSMDGKHLFRSEGNLARKTSIDLNYFSSGVYIVQIGNGIYKIAERILKH